MSETESSQKFLLKRCLNNDMDFVIKDKEERKEYQIEEIKNKVILGDTLKVLKKINNEVKSYKILLNGF